MIGFYGAQPQAIRCSAFFLSRIENLIGTSVNRNTPPLLGFSVAYMARLALGIGHRQAANGCRLASLGLSLVLDLEGSTGTTGTPRDRPRDSRPDPQDVAGESYLGCTQHSRRVAETRHRHRREKCHEVHGALPQATFSNLAHFPRQPRLADRLR